MKKFLDLGLQPLANSYLDDKNLFKREKKFRLEIAFVKKLFSFNFKHCFQRKNV